MIALYAVPILFFLAIILAALVDTPWKQDPQCPPMRHQDNRERRAAWAMRYFAIHEAEPNHFFNFPTIRKHVFNFPIIRKHGTGINQGE